MNRCVIMNNAVCFFQMTLSALNVFLLLFKNCIVYLIFGFLTSERLMRVLCYIILTLKKINKLTYFLSCIYVLLNVVL